jgi:hypothetical protein
LIFVSTVTLQPYGLQRPVPGIPQALGVLTDDEVLGLCVDWVWEHGLPPSR